MMGIVMKLYFLSVVELRAAVRYATWLCSVLQAAKTFSLFY